MTAPLIPKLRGQFAEFLNVVSLAHLRLLASPTCVGLRYGYLIIKRLEVFLVSVASINSSKLAFQLPYTSGAYVIRI